MKRIKYACLEQTIHFQLKEDMGHAAAVYGVKREAEDFKERLAKGRAKYLIVAEETLEDGSILLRLKKQYNDYPVGDYLKEE